MPNAEIPIRDVSVAFRKTHLDANVILAGIWFPVENSRTCEQCDVIQVLSNDVDYSGDFAEWDVRVGCDVSEAHRSGPEDVIRFAPSSLRLTGSTLILTVPSAET